MVGCLSTLLLILHLTSIVMLVNTKFSKGNYYLGTAPSYSNCLHLLSDNYARSHSLSHIGFHYSNGDQKAHFNITISYHHPNIQKAATTRLYKDAGVFFLLIHFLMSQQNEYSFGLSGNILKNGMRVDRMVHKESIPIILTPYFGIPSFYEGSSGI